MNEPDAFSTFLRANDQAQEEMGVADEVNRWVDSPFQWLMMLPSRSRGKAGEVLVSAWLRDLSYRVERSQGSEYDRLLEGRKVEIKLSTLWKSGEYVFQQIRPAQDYEYVLALGVSPSSASAWLMPKNVAVAHSTPQHGGFAGKDTLWLRIRANSPPSWMSEFGGSLSHVEAVVRALRDGTPSN